MKKLVKLYIGILLVLFLTSLVSANGLVAPQLFGSAPTINASGFELVSANVKIDCSSKDYLKLTSSFQIKNLGNESNKSTVIYSKSSGYPAYSQTYIKINERDKYVYLYTVNGNEYPAVDYIFSSDETVTVEISFSTGGYPFKYYLDTLMSYEKVDYEKIEIEGYCNAVFNDAYPVQLVSNNNGYKKWLWEYSNIDTSDSNLNDILEINFYNADCTAEWQCTAWYECGYHGRDPDRYSRIRSCKKCGESKWEYDDCNININVSKNCTENWTCGAWSNCINGSQSRTCTDINNCGNITNKPVNSKSCTIQEKNKTIKNITFISWQKRNESECLESCKCVGAVMSCQTETGKIMTIEAGRSGNVIVITINKIQTNTTLELEQETAEENKTKLYAKISNGRKAEIKIMPDTASEKAIERLGELNFTIELKEVGKGNETKPAYEFKAEKKGRFLGIFKIMARLQAQINAENGEIIKIKKPWWSFLASGI